MLLIDGKSPVPAPDRADAKGIGAHVPRTGDRYPDFERSGRTKLGLEGMAIERCCPGEIGSGCDETCSFAGSLLTRADMSAVLPSETQ